MKKTLTGIFLTIIFCLTTVVLNAQIKLPVITNPDHIQFEKIDVEDGISTQLTSCILEDKYGFIWIGSLLGLNRYDGYSTKVFHPRIYDSTSISDDWIWSLLEDKSGNIWACTGRGFCRFNRASETFTSFYPDTTDYNSPDNIIYAAHEDSKGLFWLITKAGLYSFNKKDNNFISYKNDSIVPGTNTFSSVNMNWQKFRFFEDRTGTIWIANETNLKKYDRTKDEFVTYIHDPEDPFSLSNNITMAVVEDKTGAIWISTWGGGLNKLEPDQAGGMNKDKTKFKHYKHAPGNARSLINDSIFPLYIDDSGNLWAGGRNGFSRYNYKTDDFISYSYPGYCPLSFLKDKNGNIWLHESWRGAHCFNPQNNSMLHFVNDILNPVSLSDNLVIDIIEDQSGSVYILTWNAGINKIDAAKKPFRHYFSNPHDPEGLNDNQILSFYKDNAGNLWIATYGGGLNKLVRGVNEGSSERFIHYKHDPQNPRSLSSNMVSQIYRDKDGTLWIGTYYGLNKFNPETELFTRYQHDDNNPQSINGNTVEAIYEDSRGIFWIVTRNGGVDIMNRQTGEFEHINSQPENPNKLGGDLCAGICEDQMGSIWIWDFKSGLFKLVLPDSVSSDNIKPLLDNPELDITNFRYDPANPQSLSSNDVMFMYEDSSGRLWIATSKGLNLFDYETESFTVVDERHGLPDQVICGILEDAHGNLWLSTQKGISRLILNRAIKPGNADDMGELIVSVTNYDKEDGLNGINFFVKSCYKASSGEMYFGSLIHGFNVFHPDSIKDNLYIPPVYITAFYKFNEQVFFEKPVYELEEIVLSYKEDVFTFEFIALNYSNSEKNQYAYMLEGFDEDWVECGIRREAKYTNIDPGKYVFRVKGSNNDGLWNEEGDSIKIIITPPFWATWWFRGLVILILISGLISFYYVRMNSLRKEKRLLEQKVKERTVEVVKQKDEIQEKNEELKEQKEEILSANEELEQQNEEINAQKEELEAQRNLAIEQKDYIVGQSKSITDSIQYAQRIQSAMLPPKVYINELLHENFILYKPRDVVSGDFYWVKQVNHYIILAAADCTGHGVPGAFMSMLGISFLNEIVQKREITQTNQVLNELRRQIKHSLRQHGQRDESKDGMDIAICAINTKDNMVQYSGAFNPLYLIRDVNGKSELKEIKADRMPVGFYHGKDKSFTNNEIQLEIGDTFYIFSDGYTDQTGKEGKKFMTKNLKELLLEIQEQSMAEQKEILERKLAEWMGNEPQIDDILVMGVRIE
ncbi:MAG: SpoIIE family protein phosphatase [Bacteroidales bacterium]|nr:SpoIIE family protein phosphatase [Bacteroidales bacterium]